MATDDPLLRFNGRVHPVQLAYMLDDSRVGSALVRDLMDERIKESSYDYDRLQAAANVVAEAKGRDPFKEINSTEEIYEIAEEIDPSFDEPTGKDLEEEIDHDIVAAPDAKRDVEAAPDADQETDVEADQAAEADQEAPS